MSDLRNVFAVKTCDLDDMPNLFEFSNCGVFTMSINGLPDDRFRPNGFGSGERFSFSVFCGIASIIDSASMGPLPSGMDTFVWATTLSLGPISII